MSFRSSIHSRLALYGEAGEYISKQLAGRMNILDVGCDAGYLTTWYAHLDPQGTVLGIDSSKQAITLARRFADKFGITNVDFRNQDVTKNDLGGPYDAIVELFVLNGDLDLPAIFQALRSALTTGGVFIFVERLRNQECVDQFVESLSKGGFQTFLDHGYVAATDCGERERLFQRRCLAVGSVASGRPTVDARVISLLPSLVVTAKWRPGRCGRRQCD